MLIKHIRDDFRVPFATIVALNEGQVGIAICNPKDNFSRKRGIKIAEGRAFFANSDKLMNLNRYVYKYGDLYHISQILSEEVEKMRDRARRYFSKEE